ncbi:MAG TPA: hypothetical protein VGR72_12935 [Candidatus Acidoferrales bacterium]|nr:hypothetical protein [Candidatus Acidoferrales bacterium]
MHIQSATTLVRVFLCVLLFTVTISAQKKPEYRTGHLLKVEDSTDLMDQTHKANYLLHIRDGADEYVARYSMTWFGHDRSGLLKPDTDVSYRISGKSLFVKTPDGKEIKARLCKMRGSILAC